MEKERCILEKWERAGEGEGKKGRWVEKGCKGERERVRKRERDNKKCKSLQVIVEGEDKGDIYWLIWIRK